MTDFDLDLDQRLGVLRDQGLYRELRRIDSPQSPRIAIAGESLLNFSSNDYLGLATDPVLREAAIHAVERYGAGAGASRLISGSLGPHHELDEALAGFKETEAALSFSSGYAAALGTVGALVGQGDIVLLDKRVHACIVDAARLCGAKLRVFRHNDLAGLERLLQWAANQPGHSHLVEESPKRRILVVTESVFSMDGDHAPLREIVALKTQYRGWLMVDEAHATGLYGRNRRGLAEELGLSHEIEVQMGTLGKALGSSGGYICGSRLLIDFLINRARTFIFSTAPVPAAAAAATAALRLVQSQAGEERRNLLWQRVSALIPGLASKTNARAATQNQPADLPSAIIPIMLGSEVRATETAAALRSQGLFIPAIRYPTVARGQARLRLTVTAAHSQQDIVQLISALRDSRLEIASHRPDQTPLGLQP